MYIYIHTHVYIYIYTYNIHMYILYCTTMYCYTFCIILYVNFDWKAGVPKRECSQPSSDKLDQTDCEPNIEILSEQYLCPMFRRTPISLCQRLISTIGGSVQCLQHVSTANKRWTQRHSWNPTIFWMKLFATFCVTLSILRISKRGLRVGPFRASGRLDPFYTSFFYLKGLHCFKSTMGSHWCACKFGRWLRFPDCIGTGSRTPQFFSIFARSLQVQIARKTPKTWKTNALFGKVLNSMRKECEKGEAAIADARRLHPDRPDFHFQIAESQSRHFCHGSGVHFVKDEFAEVECRRSMTGGWSQHRWGPGIWYDVVHLNLELNPLFSNSQIWRVGNRLQSGLKEFETWVEQEYEL